MGNLDTLAYFSVIDVNQQISDNFLFTSYKLRNYNYFYIINNRYQECINFFKIMQNKTFIAVTEDTLK